MRFQFSIIIIIFMLCTITTQSTSKYDGVSWNERRNLWQAEFYFNGKKQKYYLDNELDAAKKLNKLWEKMGIPLQHPEIYEIRNEEKKEKTSQYKGVTWHKSSGKWYVTMNLKGQKQKYGGIFNDELDAAKKVNQLCEELGIPPYNPTISATPNHQCQKKEKTSQYKGVSWDKSSGKWYVTMYMKGQKQKYGGIFNDELDAAKRVNQICEELGIPPQNPTITAMPTHQYQKREKISQYKGVTWHKLTGKWYVQLQVTGKRQMYGGMFNDELDAGKRVNQLCEESGIPLKNPTISARPNEQYQKREKTSQYKGVYWYKQRNLWSARMRSNEGKLKFGGSFKYELDAAKRVNQLCEELGIPLQNPEISAMPNQQRQKREKISQYKGVTWHKRTGKWYVQVQVKGQKQRFGGMFNNELDAAKKVNQLCDEYGILQQNPTISTRPNQQYETTEFDYNTMQAEFDGLIKIIDEYNDPATTTLKESLIAAKNYGVQTTMTEINLRTKNEESALSIAAKHGFSNVVKFLISKGADKEHFTNEHHTPLSLAVRQNHLKVVQVLFEEWISPNSHEKPYLHLSPIFNVKSREIAQLLVDNDAVTHQIYNDKNQSPLTVACKNGYLDVVEFFLDDGLDINHLDVDNKTPLHYALINKHHAIAKLLISKEGKNMSF